MESSALKALYATVQQRKQQPTEGSYTCYLFEKGLDKILKKVGEEASEVIIAAKNGVEDDTANEICDLFYHIVVLLVEQGIELNKIEEILTQRSMKIGNLKQFHQTDHNS